MGDGSDRQNRGVGVAEAAGGLVTSMGRFSLAMGFFAARQAVRLLSAPGEQAAASLVDAANAASGQLTGIARKALAVGANVEHGIVDAAFDVAGIGQALHDATLGLSMPLGTCAVRRVTGVQTVAAGAVDRPVSQREFIQQLADHYAEAVAGGPQPKRTVDGLWKSEGLATTVARHLLPENFLNDPSLPSSVLPVVHVGFGSGSAEFHLFDAATLNAVFADRCARDYRDFAYEGIGAILRAYERGFFKLMSGMARLIPLDAADGPSPTNFFSDFLKQFPPDIQRLIAHGYGRLLAFSNLDVYKTIRQATALPHERVEPVVHGAAFAFAMMNSVDLPLILEQSAVPFEPRVRAAFQNGLVYGLAFMDWYVPGVLADWRPQGSLETELIDHARREAALAVDRGFPLAFRLANPRS